MSKKCDESGSYKEWNFCILEETYADDAAKEAKKKINDDYGSKEFVKVAISDMSPGHARSAIFWKKVESNEAYQMNIPPVAVEWEYKIHQSLTNYKDLAEDICENLHSLTKYQQYYANVQFTNSGNSHKATMTLWYPKDEPSILSEV